jgi:hypothetical protein
MHGQNNIKAQKRFMNITLLILISALEGRGYLPEFPGRFNPGK